MKNLFLAARANVRADRRSGRRPWPYPVMPFEIIEAENEAGVVQRQAF